MDDQDALISLLIATHPARLEILNYLRRGESALSTIQSALVNNETVRRHGPGGDEATKHVIGFFLTDLQEHGLLKSEMRPALSGWTLSINATGNYNLGTDDQWHHFNACGAVYYPPTHCGSVYSDEPYCNHDYNNDYNTYDGTSYISYPQYMRAERWYWLTELGEHALNIIKSYLGLSKWIEVSED